MSLVSFPVAHWRCPCCKIDVPRLLPNGLKNQVIAPKQALALPQAFSLLQTFPQWQDHTLCLSCEEVINELLGSIVVAKGQKGDIFQADGVRDSSIIAGILVGDPCIVVLAHPIKIPTQWHLIEQIPFDEFDVDRISYPTQQGVMDDILWQVYQTWLKQLEQRYISKDL